MTKDCNRRFQETLIAQDLHFSLGCDVQSHGYFMSIPVSTGHWDYEEYYHLSNSQYETYLKDPDSGLAFSNACRMQQNDHLLLEPALENRGVSGIVPARS